MNRRSFLTALPAVSATKANAAVVHLDLHGSDAFIDIGAVDAGFRTLVRSWILKSSEAVSHYYEKFPVPRVAIKVLVIDGNGVGNGVTIPGNIPKITVHVGDLAGEATLMQSDWVMVHEIIHLAFPWMTAKYN